MKAVGNEREDDRDVGPNLSWTTYRPKDTVSMDEFFHVRERLRSLYLYGSSCRFYDVSFLLRQPTTKTR